MPYPDLISKLNVEIKALNKLKRRKAINRETGFILHRNGSPLRAAFLDAEKEAYCIPLPIQNILQATTYDDYLTAARMAAIVKSEAGRPKEVLEEVIKQKTDLVNMLSDSCDN